MLLWSPGGSGHHWDGPGMAASRIYRSTVFADDEIVLVHGHPDQDPIADPYRKIVDLGPLGTSYRSVLRFLRRADRWLRDNALSFDVVHAVNAFEPTVRPAATAHRLGVPVALKPAQHHFDLADKPGWSTRLGRPARRREIVRTLPAVIAISSAIDDELREIGVEPSHIHRIPNGVDTARLQPVTDLERRAGRQVLGWPADATVVLTVGALVERKGQHLLVEALARLPHTVHLVLAGPRPDPDQETRIRELIVAHGLHERVTVEDFRTDPAPWYRAADVFALCSSNEGLANVVLEAMASGLPVVATETSGTADLVTHGTTGFSVTREVDDIATALRAHVDDPATRRAHGAAGRAVTEAEFALDRVAQRHRELFLTLAERRADRS